VRILVVEDDSDIQSTLASVLGEEGYEVSAARDGAQALARLEEGGATDLILLDLRMPVMDGWAFRTLQRQDSRLAAIPVVAMSADGSPIATAVSAQAFVRKPLDLTQLLATIERVLWNDQALHQSAERDQLERFASLERVTAGVGHEINNPLTVATLNVAFAHDTTIRALHGVPSSVGSEAPASPIVSDALREDLGGIEDALAEARIGLERVRQIVAKLQSLSTVSNLERRELNLETVLDEAIEIAQYQIRHKARVTKRYGGIPAAEGDAAALTQVFLNLLVNAAQAIREGARSQNEIAVSTTHEGQHLVIEIRDTGEGIALDVLPRIFDPFFTTKGVNGGTGLGLAISRQIVEDHGGRLTVASESGCGTLCRVYLPVPQSRAPAMRP
jgi:signal transduction histidine kinase